jgi:AraC-like DNA-binding protein
MLESSQFMRESPDVTADPFSDILRITKAETVSSGGFTAGGAWSIRFPRMDKMRFGAVVSGGCWMRVEDGQAFKVEAGDVCLMAVQQSVIFSSDPEIPPIEAESVFRRGHGKMMMSVAMPMLGDGKDCFQIGGHICMDPVNGKMLAEVLPPLILVRSGSAQAGILRALLDQLVSERKAELPGTNIVSSQLAQLIFVLILRAYVETSPPMAAGWLRALSDRNLAPAIKLMHGEPGRSWRLEELAKATGMSRTVFMERFKTAAGVTPLVYLTNWRMRLAERMLRETDASLSSVAPSLGYASESAFSNAFKRVTGVAPTEFRSSVRSDQAG